MTTKDARMTHLRPGSRLLPLLLAAVAALLVTASPAAAQAIATATPSVAGGKATKLHWQVDGMAAPVSGRVPSSLVLTAPGFKLDRHAVAKRCGTESAKLNECPKASTLGTGSLSLLVQRPIGPNNLTFTITFFRGSGSKVLAVTDFIGIRVIPGVLDATSDGITLTFDPLPTPPPIPGVSYQFTGVTADLGAKLKVVKKVRKHHKKVKKTFRYSLVATPKTCSAGSWAATATLAFPDMTTAPLAAPIACTAR
jgi:hypothetical protein